MNLVWHFDFHTPAHVRVGERCDFEGVAQTLKDARVDGVIYFAKCHYGFSYYPTEIGTRHPRLAADVFGGLVQASRNCGIKAEAYVSFGIDGAGGEARPDWRRVYPDGSSDPSGWFINVCPFTSYVDERVLPQIEELFRSYQPDGYWFDTMSALSPCYCPHCVADFRRETGSELPISDEDPLQALAGQWRHDRGFALVTRIARFIKQLDPSASVGFNQLGSLPYPEPMPDGVTVLTLDPDTSGPQSIPFSLNAAYGSSSTQPCEIMPTIFHGGWGDWSSASSARLTTTALACWARSATCIPGDRLHPEGRLTEESLLALSVIAKARSQWESDAPSGSARLAPDMVVLHSPSLTAGTDQRFFAVGDPRTGLTPINGIHRLLLDAGANFTVAAEWQIANVLGEVSLVIVPEIPELGSSTEALLLEFANAGGAILFTGQLPQVGGRRFASSGVEYSDEIWQDHAYLPSLHEGKREILIRGRIPRVLSSDAETLLAWIPAYDARPGSRYGWGIGPSSHEPSEVPALTRRVSGRGTIWFLNGPLATDYAKSGNWSQAQWIADLLPMIAPKSRAWLSESEGNLELILWCDADTTWIYLLDHSGEQLIGEGRLWARSEAGSAARKFTLHLKADSAEPSLHALSGTSANLSSTTEHLVITGEFISPFGGLRVDWKSQDPKHTK